MVVGKEQQFVPVGGFLLPEHGVTLLELLLAAQAQVGGLDLLQIPLGRKEHSHRVVRHLLFRLRRSLLHIVKNFRTAAGVVLLGYRLQLAHDYFFHLVLAGEHFLQLGDLILQILNILNALKDILPIQVAQLDLRHIFRLGLVNAKANHQIGHHIDLCLGLPDDLNRLVNIQQNLGQTLE